MDAWEEDGTKGFISFSVDRANNLSGTFTIQVPGEDEKPEFPLQGTFNRQTGVFTFSFSLEEDQSRMIMTFQGSLDNINRITGTFSLVTDIFGTEEKMSGTWTTDRKYRPASSQQQDSPNPIKNKKGQSE